MNGTICNLYCNSGKLFSYVNFFKSSGFSVRCLRD
jgi:hypothetical protein